MWKTIYSSSLWCAESVLFTVSVIVEILPHFFDTPPANPQCRYPTSSTEERAVRWHLRNDTLRRRWQILDNARSRDSYTYNQKFTLSARLHHESNLIKSSVSQISTDKIRILLKSQYDFLSSYTTSYFTNTILSISVLYRYDFFAYRTKENRLSIREIFFGWNHSVTYVLDASRSCTNPNVLFIIYIDI